MTQPEVSVLQDVLRLYDHRFLELADDQRRRLVTGTRHVLGERLADEVRAALPAAHRLRAFCIQRGLHAELERLIREETEGHRAGAVVVGGRVYAMYPYLRGVPRHDADITDEVRVEHRLDALGWAGGRVRLHGQAAIGQVAAREVAVEVILRERATAGERRVGTSPHGSGFEAVIDPAGLGPGSWDVHLAVAAFGLTREAAFGAVRDARLKTGPRERDGVIVAFGERGDLTIDVPGTRPTPGRLRRLLRRS
ncbi:hypothetical protein ACRYCC_14290 [Actinomadura scrupuli]|uniref:hypothetical protein n=1 Tax=Actinomadura scrupuli TaxID=559629 RepID=UPI003D979CCF